MRKYYYPLPNHSGSANPKTLLQASRAALAVQVRLYRPKNNDKERRTEARKSEFSARRPGLLLVTRVEQLEALKVPGSCLEVIAAYTLRHILVSFPRAMLAGPIDLDHSGPVITGVLVAEPTVASVSRCCSCVSWLLAGS